MTIPRRPRSLSALRSLLGPAPRRWFTAVAVVGVLATGCDREGGGTAVVATIFAADDRPANGALAEIRMLSDTAITVPADSVGRIRLTLESAGAGVLRVARDSTVPRTDHVYAPLLLEDGTAELEIRLEGPDRGVRYLSDHRLARWADAIRTLENLEVRHYQAYRDRVAAGQSGEVTVDWGGAVDSVRTALATEDDGEVRAALWLALLTAGVRGAEVTGAEADRALREIQPSAAVWMWRPWAAHSLVRYAATVAEGAPTGAARDGQELAGRRELASRRAAAYLHRVVEAHTDAVVQPQLLLGAMRLADAAGRRDDALAYYRRLLADHPDSRAAELAMEEAPDRRLEKGMALPPVPLPALDSTAPPISSPELVGPATLLDFWAAWCTPCVAEMPVIHEAYDRFRDRGFDVVSISFDIRREDVRGFRKRYPMPWRHAFVGADSLSGGAVAAAYGVDGLPFAVLVGPDGRILALESELRGAQLGETLERVLGD